MTLEQLSELKRYSPLWTSEKHVPDPQGEYVRFDDVQATVQPLVDELMAWAKWFRMDGDLSAANEIEATLDNYRKAMGVKK